MGQELPSNLKRVFYLKIIIAILVSVLFNSSFAQDSSDDIETGYKLALSDYESGYYVEAYRKFAALAETYPNDSQNSVLHFMAAKSLFKAGDNKGSVTLWNDFIEAFPGSRLVGEALLFKGHAFYLQGDILAAAESYIAATAYNGKSEVGTLAKSNLMPLIQRGLTISELRNLIEKIPASPVSEIMEYTLARREIDSGHYRKGMGALKSFMARYPGSREFKQARLLYDEARQKSENTIVVGLLAPVTGSFQEYGRSMIEGARLAMKKRIDYNMKVELVIKDTQGNPIVAAKAALSLAEEEPVAVVGPLRSESAVGPAIVLNERGIPMITPTASEVGLSTIGPNIYQLSPSVEQIGQALARYAIKSLKITDFAILAPDDISSTHIANAFAEAVYEQGGEVLLVSYYESGASDFKQYITPLRDILLARTEEQLAAGKLDTSDFIDPKKGGWFPKEEWPVKLGALFLPGYSDDLKLLIPQVRYHVIRTRFLGSDNWDSEELIREVKNYVGDAIYATDFHIDNKGGNWSEFAQAYLAEYHHPPDKVAALTYDATCLILDGIRQGYRDPVMIRQYLNDIDNFIGASTVISLKGSNRVNNNIGVYSIDGKKLNKSK